MASFVTIQDWMLELGLNGRELNAFAVIASFWEAGKWFQGSASYLGKWMGVRQKDTVYKALSSLMEKGLIEKRDRWERGQRLCDYRPKNWATLPQKTGNPTPKNGPGAGPKNGLHNNRPDIDSDSYREKKEIYKENFVHLSVEEFIKSHH